ncbi:NADH-ubiquinone oxidoreductase-F iron-sulfur binding region domain-containing protein [Nocardioides sp. DS6]|uniref:NADH-ubiquinone oxidoreductase-F iron-sulfur binding region domain-containing protein n=1 Tax=Nocardioides eburneus TaxID=3231482 RepID=A0ABV3T3E7_9ACTN
MTVLPTTASAPRASAVAEPPILPLGAARLLAGASSGRAVDHLEHRALAGPLVHRTQAWLCEAARTVGLLGRGGAAFPVATKLAAVRPGPATHVLVNGSESEPTSHKDRLLMRRVPHRVLDGALVAAAALGTSRVTVAVHDQEAAQALTTACGERGDATAVRIVVTPAGFVAGEVQAVVNGLDGRPAVPNGRRTLPSDRGLEGRPTFAGNVETFAQLGLLALLGPSAYAAIGTGTEPGTSLVTVFGDVPRAGVAEVAHGTPLDLLTGATGDRPVLLGGYHGTWTRARGLLLDRPALRASGLAWGAGVVVVLPETTCPLGEVARVARWLAQESAGQCGPCVFGLASLADDIARLQVGAPVDLPGLHRRLGLVSGRGACGHPDGAVRFLASALAMFPEEIGDHTTSGGCGRPVLGVLPLPGSAR